MDILKQTEAGLYGLSAANGLGEAVTGKDMFGNELTEEQRQTSLMTALGITGIAGAAKAADKIGSGNKFIPYSKEYVQNKVQKAQGSIKDMGKAIGKVEVPTGVKVRTVADTIGNTYKSIDVDKTPIKDLAQKITAKGEGSGVGKQLDNISPPSTYKERLSQTPVNNGKWIGQRGESTFISDYEDVNNILKKKELEGIEYSDAIPDFSPVTIDEVKIHNMTTDRRVNFRDADELLAEKLGVTRKDIVKLRREEKLTWHELNDMKTMQLVPTVINSKFGHLGGVAEIKKLLGL